MKNLKKITALLLALVLASGLMAGCGNGDGKGKGGAADDKGKVYVYCCGAYVDPELEYDVEEATRYDVVIDYFDSN